MKPDRKLVVVLLITLLFIQGCATTDKRLALNELEKIGSMKVVRYETPKLLKATAGSQAIAITGIMFGALGGAFGGALSIAAESRAGRALAEECNLPDFGEVVLNGFVERVPAEVPGWPTMDVERIPVGEEIAFKSGYSLLIEVAQVRVKDGSGLSTTTTAQLVDSDRNVLWQRKMTYTSEKFNRCTSLEELEADKGKLLREELAYAAEKTIVDFIDHLKGVPLGPEKMEEKEAVRQEGSAEARAPL